MAPVISEVCEGSVSGAVARTLVNRLPRAARRSRLGVSAGETQDVRLHSRTGRLGGPGGALPQERHQGDSGDDERGQDVNRSLHALIIRPSDLRTLGPADPRTLGPTDPRPPGPTDPRTIIPYVYWRDPPF